MKRTTVTLPADLVQEARKVTKAKTQTQAVLITVREALRARKIAELQALAGHLEFHEDTVARRHRDKRLG
ncbi:MAG: DUF2191 domain-containing protein [Candidatus Hydrogenedentes bacterium]|nr:DUF2191 domain-containing protein [Candidatus Hydrogenedentota bacterium]